MRNPDAFDSFGDGMQDVFGLVERVFSWWWERPICAGLSTMFLIAILTIGLWDLFHP